MLKLELAGGWIREPYLKIEDMIMNEEKFKFLVYFFSRYKNFIKFEPCTIIIGRPFLDMVKAITDWRMGTLGLKLGSEKYE